MAQSSVLALGSTALTSSTVTIAAGSTGNFGIFTDSESGIPLNEGVLVLLDTPQQNQLLTVLSAENPGIAISGPAEIVFKRTAGGVQKGVVQYS